MPADGPVTVIRQVKDDAFIVMHLKEDGTLIGASGIGRGNAVGRDIRMAEMLIAKGAKPDPAVLANPETQLRTLLKP